MIKCSVMLVACGLAGLIPGRADASVTLSYDTTGSKFTAPANGDVVSNGGYSVTLSNGNADYQLTYTPPSPNPTYTNFVNGSLVSLGRFSLEYLGGQSTVAPSVDHFTLSIVQTNPSSGTNSDIATLTGSIQKGNGSLSLSFSNTSLTVPSTAGPNSVTYTLVGLTSGELNLLPGSLTVGTPVVVALNATASVNDSAVATPEPSTLVSACTGVVLLAGYSVRRRRRASV